MFKLFIVFFLVEIDKKNKIKEISVYEKTKINFKNKIINQPLVSKL